jgi:hypothetical protein
MPKQGKCKNDFTAMRRASRKSQSLGQFAFPLSRNESFNQKKTQQPKKEFGQSICQLSELTGGRSEQISQIRGSKGSAG